MQKIKEDKKTAILHGKRSKKKKKHKKHWTIGTKKMKTEKMKYLGKLDLDNKTDLKKRLGKGKILTHISLFTGIGGFDIGFAQAGIENRVMIEFDKFCCQTLMHNFLWKFLKERRHGHYVNKDGTPLKGPAYTKESKWVEDDLVWKNKAEMKKEIKWYHYPEPKIIEKDIKKVTTEEILKTAGLEIGECSIISGGFPCQGFSLAGKREVGDPRNFLYQEFVRIVNEAKPAMIIGENVPGLVSMQKGKIMQRICEDFAACGYDITWDILNAADYGVPQNRKRIFLIGKRVDLLRVKEDGSMAMHIAAQKGEITHPYLFYERLKRWGTKESKELFKKIEDDQMCSFKEKNEKR